MTWQRQMGLYPPTHIVWYTSAFGGNDGLGVYDDLYEKVARRGSHMLRYTIGWDKDWPMSLVYRGEPNG